jgi:DNA-binding NarL/FixJ family response regulator
LRGAVVGHVAGVSQRLLLADDDPAFRDQLTVLLADLAPDAEIVASVPDGHTAVAEAMRHSPSIVVIDYAMPGPNGGHAAAVIRQALPGARIVILSGLEPDELSDLPGDVHVVRKGAGMEEALADALSR